MNEHFPTKAKFLRVAFKEPDPSLNQHSGLISTAPVRVLCTDPPFPLRNWPPTPTSHLFLLKSYLPFKAEILVNSSTRASLTSPTGALPLRNSYSSAPSTPVLTHCPVYTSCLYDKLTPSRRQELGLNTSFVLQSV